MNPDFAKKKITELSIEATKQEATFLQHTLLISTTLLAILVSFKSEETNCCSNRIFILTIVSLCLTILFNGISFYEQIRIFRRAGADLLKEIENPQQKDFLDTSKTKFHLICLYITYVLLILTPILLCTYGVLNALNL